MITRKQYLNKEFTHPEYYAQFVNEQVKRAVLYKWTKDELKESFEKDEYFNTKITPIEAWDLLGGFKFSRTTGEMLLRPTTSQPIERKLLDEAGEGYSSSTAVCVYKEAARQILEEKI